jgi:hypothetical protein
MPERQFEILLELFVDQSHPILKFGLRRRIPRRLRCIIVRGDGATCAPANSRLLQEKTRVADGVGISRKGVADEVAMSPAQLITTRAAPRHTICGTVTVFPQHRGGR